MKKAGILAMLLAGALVLGMGVGCGGNGNQGGTQQGGTQQGGTQQGGTQQGGTEHTHAFAEGWTSDGEYHWHEATCGHAEAVTKEAHTFQNGECTVCGYYKIGKDTDVSAIVSDKLTEEEWKEALSEELFENFMLFSKVGEQESDWSFAGMNFRFAPSEQGVGSVVIGIYTEEKLEYYETDEHGKWWHMTFQKGEDHYESMEGVFGYAKGIRSLVRSLKEKFTQAVFDETLGAYLFTETDAASGLFAGQNLAFKFKNGRLCGLGGVDVEGVYQFTVVYGYGEAQIVPPENYEEAN